MTRTADGIEGLVIDSIEREMLQPLEREDLDELAIVDSLAGVPVFVDQPVSRPGQVVFHLVGRKQRQGTDPQADFIQFLELAGEVIRCDRYEARRQTALRHEDLPGTGFNGQVFDGAGGGNIFAQIEVTQAGLQRGFGDGPIDGVVQRRQDAAPSAHRPRQRVGVGAVEWDGPRPGRCAQALQRRGVDVADQHIVVAAAGEESRRRVADLARAKQ